MNAEHRADLSRAWHIMLVVAFAHGAIYALLLPPWAISDEQQHFDYAERLALGEGPPDLGRTYLLPAVANAVHASARWSKFGWPSRPSADPREWALEGYSYEAHQPPLYYALLSLPLRLLGGEVHDRLYLARLVMLVLSLVTLVCLRRTLLLLWPGRESLALLGCLVLVALPARTASIARVNNDGLAEAVGAVLVLAMTRWRDGLTPSRGLALGALLAAALLTKSTMAALAIPVFWLLWWNRRSAGFVHVLVFLFVPVILAFGFFVFHLTLHANPKTLVDQWLAISGFETPPLGPREVVRAVGGLFTSFWLAQSFWVVWRYGDPVRAMFVSLAFWPVFVLVIGGALAAIVRRGTELRRAGAGSNPQDLWSSVLASAVVAGVLLTIALFFSGFAGSADGRFLLPYLLPVIVFLVAAFDALRLARFGLLTLSGVLLAVGVAWFLDHELGGVYLRSAYAVESLRSAGAAPGLGGFLHAIMSDKPAWVGPPALAAVIVFIGGWFGLGWLGFRCSRTGRA